MTGARAQAVNNLTTHFTGQAGVAGVAGVAGACALGRSTGWCHHVLQH